MSHKLYINIIVSSTTAIYTLIHYLVLVVVYSFLLSYFGGPGHHLLPMVISLEGSVLFAFCCWLSFGSESWCSSWEFGFDIPFANWNASFDHKARCLNTSFPHHLFEATQVLETWNTSTSFENFDWPMSSQTMQTMESSCGFGDAFELLGCYLCWY